MFVEGIGKRLAVECDGDRYHPIEKLAEDMNRQAILERLGWKFARIRGSAFYRNPDQAMESVFTRLDELAILPNTSSVSGSGKNDTTLIDELKSIISNGFVDEPCDDSREVGVEETTIIEPTEINPGESVAEDTDKNGLDKAVDSKISESPIEAVTTEKTQGGNVPQNVKAATALAEYTSYAGPPCHDPRISRQEQIAEGLQSIVKAEGPVQVKRAFDIYLRSCGIKRMEHELRDGLLGAVAFLKHSNMISSHKYVNDDDSLSEIIWIKETTCEVLRKRGDRSLEEIPLGELFAISHLVAKSSNTSLGSEEHLREILDWLDLKRLTTNAETILKGVIAGGFVKNPQISEM